MCTNKSKYFGNKLSSQYPATLNVCFSGSHFFKIYKKYQPVHSNKPMTGAIVSIVTFSNSYL